MNYCPFCHRHGVLVYNPKHTYEGEWTCRHCDADFCNCGRCKAGGSHTYLVKYSQARTQPEIEKLPNKSDFLKLKLDEDYAGMIT